MSIIASNPAESNPQYNQIINHKLIFDQSTARNKKRILQMKQRKAYLNDDEDEIPQTTDNIIQSSIQCTTELTPTAKDIQVHHNDPSLAPHQKAEMSPDAEVIISDLDCSINSTEEKSKEKAISDKLPSHSKPFIQMNNHLKFKAKTDSESCPASYLLALQQGEETAGSEVKRTHYDVNDIIKEEKENDDSPVKGQFPKVFSEKSMVFTKERIGKDLSKSGDYCLMKSDIKKYMKKGKEKKQKEKEKSASMMILNEFKERCPLSPKTMQHKSCVNSKGKKEKNHLTMLTSFNVPSFKPKTIEGYNNKLKTTKHIRSQTALYNNESMPKLIIGKDSYRKINDIPLCPSLQKIKPSLSNHFLSNNVKHSQNIQVNKKKMVYHKKNLTITFPEKKQVNVISNTKSNVNTLSSSSIVLLHKTASTFQGRNSNKEIMTALVEKLKFLCVEHHNKALSHINKSTRNMYVLVRKLKDSTSLIFKGLYEISTTGDHVNIVYSPSFCPYRIPYDEIKLGYSYNKQSGSFTKDAKIKKEKKFGNGIQCFSI